MTLFALLSEFLIVSWMVLLISVLVLCCDTVCTVFWICYSVLNGVIGKCIGTVLIFGASPGSGRWSHCRSLKTPFNTNLKAHDKVSTIQTIRATKARSHDNGHFTTKAVWDLEKLETAKQHQFVNGQVTCRQAIEEKNETIHQNLSTRLKTF